MSEGFSQRPSIIQGCFPWCWQRTADLFFPIGVTPPCGNSINTVYKSLNLATFQMRRLTGSSFWDYVHCLKFCTWETKLMFYTTWFQISIFQNNIKCESVVFFYSEWLREGTLKLVTLDCSPSSATYSLNNFGQITQPCPASVFSSVCPFLFCK